MKTPTKQIILSCCLFIITASTYAQIGKSKYVIRDSRVDKLVEKQIEYNKPIYKGRKTVQSGFRIIVISTSNRDDATKAKGTLMRTFPDQKSYMLFQSPNFKVQFGNFRTYNEAEEMKSVMESIFPRGLLIVPAKVEVIVAREE